MFYSAGKTEREGKVKIVTNKIVSLKTNVSNFRVSCPMPLSCVLLA